MCERCDRFVSPRMVGVAPSKVLHFSLLRMVGVAPDNVFRCVCLAWSGFRVVEWFRLWSGFALWSGFRFRLLHFVRTRVRAPPLVSARWRKRQLGVRFPRFAPAMLCSTRTPSMRSGLLVPGTHVSYSSCALRLMSLSRMLSHRGSPSSGLASMLS